MQPKIIVYTTPLCAPCELLKRILVSERLVFEVQDLLVNEAAAALMEKQGIRTAPVLSIDGLLYSGEDLNPDRLVALLDC
jgi:glutaredoxin